MAEEPKPGSPLWWVRKLERKLAEQQKAYKRCDAYYSGDHPLAFATPKFRTTFGGLFSEFADNWCDLVADAVEERLNVTGFRFGNDRSADKKAWDIWQANNMDAGSQMTHQEALVGALSFVLVWVGEDHPQITVEHATEMVVHVDSATRRRLAALKVWTDDAGYRHATLYLPDGIHKYRSRTRRSEAAWSTSTSYVERPGTDSFVPNPYGVVTVVPFLNRGRLIAPPQSEFHQVIPIQDGINKLVADMLVTSESSAARQRWATGLEVPVDPDTKQPIPVFKPLMEAILTSKNEKTKFGDFEVTDLRNFTTGIEMLVQHTASRTRTPPHYFYLSGQFPSGESIKSAETGLVAKARRRMVHFGESWEEVMRLAFLIAGDKRKALITSTETIWGDPESRSESEHVDAVMKKRSLSVPVFQLWEDLGYSPQQIARFKEMLREEKELGIAPGTLPNAQPPASTDIPAAV